MSGDWLTLLYWIHGGGSTLAFVWICEFEIRMPNCSQLLFISPGKGGSESERRERGVVFRLVYVRERKTNNIKTTATQIQVPVLYYTSLAKHSYTSKCTTRENQKHGNPEKGTKTHTISTKKKQPYY